MFEQLKEKHLAKKQEWSREKDDLRKQLDKAHQQIRALQNLPKEIEERYKNFKKFQTQYEDLKERFDTEQLKWELDKNYLKQMVERLRSDLARNLCYLCKCPLDDGEEAYYRNKISRNEEKLVHQLDELENEKRHLVASHRREREKWNNEKKILRDKIEKLNANIDKTYTSPLILHGSHLSSNSPYSSSINRGSSADLNFSFPGSRSSQEQGFHMVIDELLQHIKKIDEELDDDMYEKNNSQQQQQQQQRHAYDKQPQTSGGEVSYKTKKTTYMSSRSFDESNKQQLSSNQQQQSKAAQMQGSGGYQPQPAPRMMEATSTSGRGYQSEKQIFMKHEDMYIPMQQMDERMSVLSSPTTCSLPAFSDSGESETTAFTTPLPFLRKNEFDMQPIGNDFYRHQQQHQHSGYHNHHHQQQERYYQAQVNKAPNYPNLNYPTMVQPVHKYYATRDSSNSPDLTFMRMQKPTTHSPRSPAQEVSSDSRSTPRQRKTLSNLHQQLLFRKSFGQGFEDSPVFQQHQQQTKNNFLGVEGVMYNDHHLHNLPHHQQHVYQSSSKSITPQNKQHEKLTTSSGKSIASPSNTFASSSSGSKPTYQRSNTEGIYSSVVRHQTTQQYHGLKRPHEVQLPKQKTEEMVRVGPKVPPKPKVSLDELLEVNNLTRRRDDDGYQQEEKSGNASTRGGNRMANLGKMGKQWIRKRLPFWEESKEPTGDGGGLFQGVENKAYMREKSGDAHVTKALNRRSVNFGAANSGTGEVKKAKRYTRSKTEVAVKGDSYSSSEDDNEERSKATRNVKLRRARTINRQNSNSNDKKKRQSIKSEVHVPLLPSTTAALPIDEVNQNEPATSHSFDKAKHTSGGKTTANNKHLAPATGKKESEKSSSSASTLKSSKKEKSKSDKETDSLVHSVVAKLNSIKENNDKTPKLEKPVKRMSSLREYLSQQRRKTDSLFAKNGKKSSSTESSNDAAAGSKGADNKSTREAVKMRVKEKSSVSVSEQPETIREEKAVNRRWSVIEESGKAVSGGGGGGKRKPYRRSKTQYLNCDEKDDDEDTDTDEKKPQS